VVQLERQSRSRRCRRRVLAHKLDEFGSHSHSDGYPSFAIVFNRTEWQARDPLRRLACTSVSSVCYRRRESALFVFYQSWEATERR
jgi:hypothetical protein